MDSHTHIWKKCLKKRCWLVRSIHGVGRILRFSRACLLAERKRFFHRMAGALSPKRTTKCRLRGRGLLQFRRSKTQPRNRTIRSKEVIMYLLLRFENGGFARADHSNLGELLKEFESLPVAIELRSEESDNVIQYYVQENF